MLLDAARGARRVVEIGVYEGASAVALCGALGPDAELHLIDPFGRHPDALPGGWGASERATRRVLARAARRLGAAAPELPGTSRFARGRPRLVAARSTWCSSTATTPRPGCELDWLDWSPFVAVGGHVVFHDARADQPGGRGLPGPDRGRRAPPPRRWLAGMDGSSRRPTGPSSAPRPMSCALAAIRRLDPKKPGQTH